MRGRIQRIKFGKEVGLGRRIVIPAIMARIIGKEMICLYCVPTPISNTFREADDAANKVSRRRRLVINIQARSLRHPR